MSDDTISIDVLTTPATEAEIGALARLLVDAVARGAAVSFMAPLAREAAAEWWRGALAGLHARSRVLVARERGEIVGAVTLHAAWAPNQPHRAEIAKLLVSGEHRRRGIGRALMLRAESLARASGFTLLTLDAREGGAAEELYRNLGWTYAGTIPGYALNADGSGLHATVVYYKQIM